MSLVITGEGASSLFQDEGGGHRWQRVPPTETRGRVHTSTVTVAVLTPTALADELLNPRDVEIKTTRGSGPGGQHRNTTESCVIATHRPTGLTARIDMKSQHQSRAMALRVLAAKLREIEESALANRANQSRKAQLGSGMRGDKIRTYRTQDNTVRDHRTGGKWQLSRWQTGIW